MDFLVYTANFGNKDKIRRPDIDVEFFYFSDKKIKIPDCNVVRCDISKYQNTRFAAKWYKLHPHILFPNRNTIWIDANYKIVADPTRIFTDDIVLYRHASERSDLYEEAKVCLDRKAGDPVKIKEQINAYKKEGIPKNYGLYQGNVLMRKSTTAFFNDLWWENIIKFSQRDQISLPYVLWKYNIKAKILNHNLKREHFFKCGKHLFHGTKEL